MTFKRLEDRLPEEGYEDYIDIVDDLRDPTKTVFRYLLDMVTSIESVDLKREYTVFGGYAVLTHLIAQYGDKIVKLWRGSSDIDVAGSVNVLNLLKSFYNVESDFISPNIVDKRTVKLRIPDEDLCKIDFTLDEDQGSYQREEKYILGIPINVAGPYALIKHKLIPAQDETNHCIDIIKLLGILEYRKDSIENLTNNLDPNERKILREVIIETRGKASNKRMTAEPSDSYLSQLKSELRKRSY